MLSRRHPKSCSTPFSKEFFDDPQAIYRRMRENAPVYYNQEYDFYARRPEASGDDQRRRLVPCTGPNAAMTTRSPDRLRRGI